MITLRHGILTRLSQPDSQKGMVEQAGDMMSGAMDSGAAAMQPNVSTLSSLSAIQKSLTIFYNNRARSPAPRESATA